MSYWQVRRAVSIWGTLLIGGNQPSGTIVFGSAGDVNMGRTAANEVSMGGSDRFVGNPLNTGGGSALTSNGDFGFDGSQLYYRTGGTIYNLTPDGTIAI